MSRCSFPLIHCAVLVTQIISWLASSQWNGLHVPLVGQLEKIIWGKKVHISSPFNGAKLKIAQEGEGNSARQSPLVQVLRNEKSSLCLLHTTGITYWLKGLPRRLTKTHKGGTNFISEKCVYQTMHFRHSLKKQYDILLKTKLNRDSRLDQGRIH